jgi:hypothetical protein
MKETTKPSGQLESNEVALDAIEFHALCRELHGSLLDRISGTEIRRFFLLECIETDLERVDVEERPLLVQSARKVRMMTDEELERLLEQVNAFYLVQRFV